ncbi:MAG: MBL fold metallo-hydrolase [Pseudohongiellaceae bacterium]
MNRRLVMLLSLFCLNGASADVVPGAEADIHITPLVHASVQLEYRGFVVQVDPWDFLGLRGAKIADLILTTDDSSHHLDPNAIAKLRKPGTSIVVTEKGLSHVPDGIVMRNGATRDFDGVTVEAIAAYDIIPGEPSHPKGDANGYLVSLGGKRFYFAGVTECVPEVMQLRDIDVAFIPLNIPRGRMVPAAAAECVRTLSPDIVYLYHYDQGYARRLTQPEAAGPVLPGNLTILESLEKFESLLAGDGIEIRRGDFYPELTP